MSDDTNSAPGICQQLAPGLRLVLAPNPSPMTYRGTNTYILGTDAVAVIDPGPDLPAHMAAVLAALQPGERVARIIVTHAHLDHSALARPLALATGAPILAFGPAQAGRSAVMERLAIEGLSGGGEGIDHAFTPDVTLKHGQVIKAGDWRLTCLHTPGHLSNHISLHWGDAVFTGDHVMGWASSLISPPDGCMGDYMRGLALLATLSAKVFYPGHGAPNSDPKARLEELRTHRLMRETQIRARLSQGPASAQTIALHIYSTTDAALIPAATRNTFAHLLDLWQRGLVTLPGKPTIQAIFSPA